MHHRNPAFDGLRTFACLAVVLFHAAPSYAKGGWLGVDVFFVLSGFLITTLLLRERAATGRIALLVFYARCLGRLYPALLIAVLLGAVAGTEPWALASALTYSGDVARALGHDLGPLGHTWSLAVEEQFYLAWPLALLLARSRRAAAWTAAIGCAVSLALFVAFSPTYGQISFLVYNAPVTRIWELLAGCVLAALGATVKEGVNLLALAGICVCVVAAVVGDGQQHAWQVVATVAGSMAIILSFRQPSRVATVLGWGPFASLGRVSYGIYLFHYPMLAMSLPFAVPRAMHVTLKIALTVILAYVSFHLMEEPVRRWVVGKLAKVARKRIEPEEARPMPSPL